MQLIPLDFAKETARRLLYPDYEQKAENYDIKQEKKENGRIQIEEMENVPKINTNTENAKTSTIENNTRIDYGPINVQPVQFQSFDKDNGTGDKENIDLIMDVPLEISVELGRTKKLIKDILEFGPGTVIELDRLAGEPVDIIVNGKFIAKGEVVVIDESFGVRVTDIVSPNKRLNRI